MRIGREEVRQRLRAMLYQHQIPVNRIAKDIGMDAKTIQLAANGEMTNRTLIRFDKFFFQTDRGKKIVIKENFTELPHAPVADKKKRLIDKITKFSHEMHALKAGGLKKPKTLMTMDVKELVMIYLQAERKLKFMLLKRHEELIDKYYITLWDKWDYWQWKEKIEQTLKDTGR
jgi:hypothetical protein